MVPGFPCTKHFFNSVTLLKYLIRYHLTLEKVFHTVRSCGHMYMYNIFSLHLTIKRLIPEFRFCIELIIDSY